MVFLYRERVMEPVESGIKETGNELLRRDGYGDDVEIGGITSYITRCVLRGNHPHV